MMCLHLGMETKSHDLRRELIASLEKNSALFPELLNGVIVDSLVAFLSREVKRPSSKTSSDEVESTTGRHPQLLSKILSACASFSEATEVVVRKKLLVKLVVIAHHNQLCEFLHLSSMLFSFLTFGARQ